MAKRQRELEPVKVPRAAFELARERTRPLIGELPYYLGRSRYIEPGDALGDILACAYLQGITDAVTAHANNPQLLRSK